MLIYSMGVSVDGFIADQSPEVGAIGEETAGVFDIDISF